MKWILFVGLFVLSPHAMAFPEMVRHGYTNCIACHTSQSGGNLLNEYGRSLSREILSQQSLAGIPVVEGDERLAYGLLLPPKWLLLGSDIRVLQAFQESKQASRGRFLIMQVDVDASAQIDRHWRTFASLGRVEPKTADATAKDFIISPRHGVEFLFTPPEAENRIAARAGRFMPAYGIGFSEHTFVTRTLLGFNPTQERYAAELAWNNDQSSLIGTAIFAQCEGKSTEHETGGALQAATAVGEKSKIGINYYQTQFQNVNVKSTRRMYGMFSHIAFNKDWYGLFEADRTARADLKWGLVEIFKLGYEVQQGWHLIGVQEYANLNADKPDPKFESYGVGTEWFPRPHWDLYALFREERDTSKGNDFQQAVWLIAHFYL